MQKMHEKTEIKIVIYDVTILVSVGLRVLDFGGGLILVAGVYR